MLARRHERTYRGVGAAVGVSAQRAYLVVQKFAPELAEARTKFHRPVSLECAHCGQTFKVSRYKADRGSKYCSRKCVVFAQMEANEDSYRARAYRLRCEGVTWVEVAGRLGIASAAYAMAEAKRYAKVEDERGR